jgi:N4-gp56 family major capsid protein
MATIVDPAATTGTASKYILSTYYDKVMLERLTPMLRWYDVCEKKRLPQNEGKVVKFSSFRALTVGTRLTEGTRSTAKVLSAYNITATLGQWGDFVAVTDLMEVTGITSTIEAAVAVMGENAALTIDTQIKRAALNQMFPSATSNMSAQLRSRYTGSVSTLTALNGKVLGFSIRLSRQCSGLLAATARLSTVILHAASAYNAACKITLKDVREAVGVLRTRNVLPFSDGLYKCIAHPVGLSDFMGDTATAGWADWNKYTTPENMRKGIVGGAEGCQMISSTNAVDLALNRGAVVSATVFTIVGQGALGAVDYMNSFDGKGKNYIIVKKANQYDISDPLNQIAGTVGWKATFAAVVLNTSSGIHLMGLRN